MAGITGLGTTYNLPNYTGILYGLTPATTPFFSAIGNLSGGGKQTTATAFEWETYDLRNASQPSNVEGATAPTAQERVRANVSNVVQIHQEKISVSYSKQAATGLHNGINNDSINPITNEVDWQSRVMIAQMLRDVEFSFMQGVYQAPANNSTGRQTRGLLNAVTSNVVDNKAAAALPTVTATASTDLVNSTAHGLALGDSIIFTALTGGAGLTINTPYYVSGTVAANTFQVSTAKGGTPIDITSDASAATAYKLTPLTMAMLNTALQRVWDNGGLDQTTTLLVNSSQKIATSVAYANAYLKASPVSGSVGGVNVTSIDSDFGLINIMASRYVPQHQIGIVQLGQCAPVFLEVPGKGHFFAEPLAKTGSSDDIQLYGEVGLAYGNEKAHGLITGLALV